MSTIDLHDFKRNEYSQHGEDGVLARLFAEMGTTTGTFCEFGAWDGRHLSNARALLESGWRGVFIEGDPVRYEDLVRDITTDRAELMCAYVQPEGTDSLDDLLGRSPMLASRHLDLLSIDIDSDDLAVWKGLTLIKPRVVIIEFNPTIPLDIEFVNPRGECKGNSAAAIMRFASGSGYDLVAATHCNLIFVDAAHRPDSIPVRPLRIGELTGQIRYFWGYDGTLVVARTAEGQATPTFSSPELLTVPWKPGVFAQPTPQVFRRFDQRPIKNRLFRAYSLAVATATRPLVVAQVAVRRLKSMIE